MSMLSSMVDYLFCPEPPPDERSKAFFAGVIITLCIVYSITLFFKTPSPFAPKDNTGKLLGMLRAAPAPVTPTGPHKSNIPKSKTKHELPPGIDPATIQQLLEARRSVQPKDYTGGDVPAEQVTAMLNGVREVLG